MKEGERQVSGWELGGGGKGGLERARVSVLVPPLSVPEVSSSGTLVKPLNFSACKMEISTAVSQRCFRIKLDNDLMHPEPGIYEHATNKIIHNVISKTCNIL